MPKTTPVVLIIGKQNVGKTTLMKQVLPLLKKKGYRVGTIKYNVPSFEIDHEGKDTYSYYQAGADVVSISSPEKLAVIKRVHQKPPSIRDIIRLYHRDVDVALVEGYKKWRYPYIEIRNEWTEKDVGNTSPNGLKVTATKDDCRAIPKYSKKTLQEIIQFIEARIE